MLWPKLLIVLYQNKQNKTQLYCSDFKSKMLLTEKSEKKIFFLKVTYNPTSPR